MYCPLVNLIGSLLDQGLDSLLGRVDGRVHTRNLPEFGFGTRFG